MKSWFRSGSSSRQAVTHNDVYRTNSSADRNDDTNSSPRVPRHRHAELGNALTSLRNAREQGLKKLRKVDIETTAAETQRNQILNSLESRTTTVESNLTEYQRALVPDSLTRFEGSPDRQINNALRNAETVAGEWKNIRSTVKEAIGG